MEKDRVYVLGTVVWLCFSNKTHAGPIQVNTLAEVLGWCFQIFAFTIIWED